MVDDILIIETQWCHDVVGCREYTDETKIYEPFFRERDIFPYSWNESPPNTHAHKQRAGNGRIREN